MADINDVYNEVVTIGSTVDDIDSSLNEIQTDTGILVTQTDELEGLLEDILAAIEGQGPSPDPEDGGAAHVAGEGTDTQITVDQDNEATDEDNLDDPQVLNDDELSQTVEAFGGSNSGAEADDGIDGALGEATAGDDYSATGEASASADASAWADAITQDADVGSNDQVNEVYASVVGSNQNHFSVGGSEDGTQTNGIDPLPSGGDGAGQTGDVTKAWSMSPGSADTEVNVNQSNWLGDDDVVRDPEVINDDTAYQNVTATGGDAQADDGIDLANNDADLNNIGDNASVSGSASASADALAVAEMATQEINTGGNAQTNVSVSSIVGINDNLNVVGEDDGADNDDIAPDVSIFPDLIPDPSQHDDDPDADEDGTDQEFDIVQINQLFDSDTIWNPLVQNESGGGLTQVVSATGGEADTDDGIDGSGGDFDATLVGDDLSFFGSTSASADAVAVAQLLTQNISMGANFQANGVSIDIVGGSSTVEMIGEDDTL